MSEKPRRRGRPGNSRADIISAAEEQFHQRGIAETSISQISHALNITKSAVYHHVASKGELIAAVAERAQHTCASIITLAKEGEDDGLDILKNMVWELTVALAEDHGSLRLAVAASGSEELGAPLRQVRQQLRQELITHIDAARAAQRLSAALEPGVIAELIIASCVTTAACYEGEPEDAADMALSYVFQGLRA
ncbi:helix-turn-helix domain-containing protein [Corynebacterium sp. TAE3-ERU30]|uniref:TetR/AcrR family transcriptional regulator n=1 Tax=Corynebacterium sp. TAE3-ERU30 TaxID=2849496 RepID=UPI001C47852B|nr:TetR/AcrR family transcriptional regulator [Corynebacterium sp. TAE3-ERU30]